VTHRIARREIMADSILPIQLNKHEFEECEDELINRENALLKQSLDAYIDYCVDLIKNNNWKILTLIPTQDRNNSTLLTIALADMVRPPHGWVVKSGTIIDAIRNDLVADALMFRDDWTHLWLLDSDTVPPFPHTLMRLLQRDVDIVSALYCKKEVPVKWLLRQKMGLNNRFVRIADPETPLDIYPEYRNKFIPVTGAGLGCTLVKREVFEKMPPPWFKTEWLQEGTLDFNGEDIYFFEKAAKYGFKAFVDTSLICPHVEGRMTFPVPASRASTPMLDGVAEKVFRIGEMDRLLSSFLDKPVAEVRRELEAYTPLIQQIEWQEKNPQTEEEVKKFYQETPWYLYDLALWNAHDNFYYLMQQLPVFKNKRVLDFGGGIGTVAIALALKGNKVDYLDLPSLTMDFAQYRAKEYKVYKKVTWLQELDFSRKYDIIIGIDVFEHLCNLREVMCSLDEVLKPGGIVFFHNNFGQRETYPMHYDHQEEWDQTIAELGWSYQSSYVLLKG